MFTDSVGKRTAVLVRCADEEAEAIRNAAKAERRAISAFILDIVFQHLETYRRVKARVQKDLAKPAGKSKNGHSAVPRINRYTTHKRFVPVGSNVLFVVFRAGED